MFRFPTLNALAGRVQELPGTPGFEGGYWALQEAGLFFVIAAVRPGVSVDEVEAAFFQQIDQIKIDQNIDLVLVEELETAPWDVYTSGFSFNFFCKNFEIFSTTIISF